MAPPAEQSCSENMDLSPSRYSLLILLALLAEGVSA